MNTTATPRYVLRCARPSPTDDCQLCGTGWGGFPGRVCPVTTCMACGTPQCLANGLGRGRCSVCLCGLLRGWSATDRPCGYRGCPDRAVAAAPRVGYCCRAHLERAKETFAGKTRTVAEKIRWALEHRAVEWVLVPSVEDEILAAIEAGGTRKIHD